MELFVQPGPGVHTDDNQNGRAEDSVGDGEHGILEILTFRHGLGIQPLDILESEVVGINDVRCNPQGCQRVHLSGLGSKGAAV